MFEYLTDSASIKNGAERINRLMQLHGEWLCVRGPRASTLQKSDCDFRLEHGRLIFSCRGDTGALFWRVTGWEWTGDRLRLEVSRHMGADKGLLELIPRASARAMTTLLGATRRERCRHLAELACGLLKGAKVERAALSRGSRPGQPGAFARIILSMARERIAVAGIVTDSAGRNVEAFLSSTLIWFTRASERTRRPFLQRLWLIIESDLVEPLAQCLALVRDDLRRRIALYGLDDDGGLTRAELPELEALLATKRQRLRRPDLKALSSESAERIMALGPDAIDLIRSRHGETLRFHGLAFARVRRVMGRENVWFGVESRRRKLLGEATAEDWVKLINDLRTYRNEEAADHSHALYRAAPEAWLESSLRRDITRLDPGLRLAPLYTQFRPTRARGGGVSRPVDLLALRRDGRLVVIELKVAEDREHVLQGAAYWLEVEAHRRAGNIARARLFDDALIANEPALVYLVAPTLRFHRAFETLVRCISPEIEIYRFDINENWRAGVRVARRVT